MPRSSPPLRALTLALVALVVVVGLRLTLPSEPGARIPAESAEADAAGSGASSPDPDSVVMDARACFDAGYLCEGLLAEPEPRVLRWAGEMGQLVVHVSLPDGIEASQARALQRAAGAGIREWQGNPFPLRVDLGGDGSDADVKVTWTQTLNGRELGRVSSRWIRGEAGWRVEITEFVLATHSPGSGRDLTPGQVELTSAHEMGHVLGLPHSDDTRDVMYPLNTSVRLTSRDFRTLGALYDLPVGTLLVVEDAPGR